MADIRHDLQTTLTAATTRTTSQKVYAHHNLPGGQIDTNTVTSSPIVKGAVNVSGYSGKAATQVIDVIDPTWETITSATITGLEAGEAVVGQAVCTVFGGEIINGAVGENTTSSLLRFRFQLETAQGSVFTTLSAAFRVNPAAYTIFTGMKQIIPPAGATSGTLRFQACKAGSQPNCTVQDTSVLGQQVKR